MIGYIKLYRQLFENPDYFAEKFSRIQAWIDLLLLANYEESAMYVRGIKMQVGRGQLAKSMDSLAERWRWSRFKVEEYLKELENQQQINVQKNNVISLITITNYERYQGLETENSDKNQQQINVQIDGQIKEKGSNPPPPPITQKENNKEEKEKKKDNNKLLSKKCQRPSADAPIEERKQWLVESMKEADNGLPKLMLNEFYLYWTETTPGGTKMRFELEKTWITSRRLARWYNNNQDKKWNK